MLSQKKNSFFRLRLMDAGPTETFRGRVLAFFFVHGTQLKTS
jgi:hypothetical protein